MNIPFTFNCQNLNAFSMVTVHMKENGLPEILPEIDDDHVKFYSNILVTELGSSE